MPELKESQRTAIAYAHFTLDEWKLLVMAMAALRAEEGCSREDFFEVMQKFPSAVL